MTAQNLAAVPYSHLIEDAKVSETACLDLSSALRRLHELSEVLSDPFKEPSLNVQCCLIAAHDEAGGNPRQTSKHHPTNEPVDACASLHGDLQ